MTTRHTLAILTALAFLVLAGASVGAMETTQAAKPVAPSGVCPAVQNTLYFSIVYGPVTLDGVDAPVGTVVEARNPRGDTAGCFVATDAGSYGTFYVYGEDVSVKPPAPGMRDGEVVAFYVDGYSATASPQLAWADDHSIHQVGLDADTITATATVTPTVEPTPSSGTCPTVQNTLDFTIVYGPVTLDGVDAPVGTVVEARGPRGDTVGCFVVDQAGSYGTVYVYGEDTSITPTIPGMRDGEVIAFYVNDSLAEADPQSAWSNDRDFHEVALNAVSSISPMSPKIYLPLVVRNQQTYHQACTGYTSWCADCPRSLGGPCFQACKGRGFPH